MQLYQMPQRPLTGIESGTLFTGQQKAEKPQNGHTHVPPIHTWSVRPCGLGVSPDHSPMLYFCCTSRTTWVLADLRKSPSVVRARGQWGLVSLRALGSV